jgi:hypothetical protein
MKRLASLLSFLLLHILLNCTPGIILPPIKHLLNPSQWPNGGLQNTHPHSNPWNICVYIGANTSLYAKRYDLVKDLEKRCLSWIQVGPNYRYILIRER